MKVTESSNIPRAAFVIIILQVIAWVLILTHFFEDYNAGNDAAGAGMAEGFAVLFVVAPCMVFIFFATFYFLKKHLPIWFRLVAMFNYVGLLIAFSAINW